MQEPVPEAFPAASEDTHCHMVGYSDPLLARMTPGAVVEPSHAKSLHLASVEQPSSRDIAKSQDAAVTEVSCGCTVQLGGLTKRADLNGRLGLVIGKPTRAGRVPVRIIGEDAPVAVRAVHIVACRRPDRPGLFGPTQGLEELGRCLHDSTAKACDRGPGVERTVAADDLSCLPAQPQFRNVGSEGVISQREMTGANKGHKDVRTAGTDYGKWQRLVQDVSSDSSHGGSGADESFDPGSCIMCDAASEARDGLCLDCRAAHDRGAW